MLTVPEIAELLGVEAWRIRRLYERRLLAEPPRIGRARAIDSDEIPAIVDALRCRGWLPDVASAAEGDE
jgi:hypothetical protein